MNKTWSEKNKEMQTLIKKEVTFAEGIKTLEELRNSIFEEILSFKTRLSREDYNEMPFINANGYHNLSVAFSLWHIFRIEDIVLHTMIKNDKEIFFLGDYKQRISSPIITTGNELEGLQIKEFSEKLNIDELFNYILEVKKSSDDYFSKLKYYEIKRKMTEVEKSNVKELSVVSENGDAVWLIDYWGSKDIKGLIQMPFSRHWIMHIDACSRIIKKLGK